jgi:cell division septum initiation protein DivIVA
VLIFLIGLGTPMGSGVWLIADLSSRLSSLEDSVASIPSSDNSAIVERITAVEMTAENNKDLLDKANADIDKVVEHLNDSMEKITNSMNSNPLANGN